MNKIFKSSRQSCVLTSYTHLLNLLCESSFSPQEIFNLYNRYFQTIHYKDKVDGEDLIKWIEKKHNNWYMSYIADCEKIKKSYNNKYKVSKYKGTTRELLSSILLHYHCQVLNGNISGYTHLSEFHKYLCSQNSYKKYLNDIKVEDIRQNQPIDVDLLIQKLNNSLNIAALLLIQSGKAGHSIMVKHDGNMFIQINPNIGIEEDFDWKAVNITEYIVFKHTEQ